jgi:hypothetical protein
LHHLTNKETIVRDVVDDYGKCGTALIERLETCHQEEHNAVNGKFHGILDSLQKGMRIAMTSLEQYGSQRDEHKVRVEQLVESRINHRRARSKELEKLMRMCG